jgi:hypothetical protein
LITHNSSYLPIACIGLTQLNTIWQFFDLNI